jgi:hypothetical protein
MFMAMEYIEGVNLRDLLTGTQGEHDGGVDGEGVWA